MADARRGRARPRAGSAGDRRVDGSREGRAQGGPASAPEATPLPICQVAFCPICMVVTAMGDVRPELMEHVLLAGREVLLALRAVIDARLEGKDQPARLERLTIE